jgi:DNA (cytosine-5)-methyltransferase 1
MIRDQFILDINDELIVDNFAGGGGASTGIEMALGRHVDLCWNHDPQAVAMHQANHPQTTHYCESVWDAKPLEATKGRRVGLAWFSPDCKHFSKAKGGTPKEKKIRGLAWVVLYWVKEVRPRVIILENVEEFVTWGPLDAKGNPHAHAKGQTFRSFVGGLRRRGYAVEWRELRACDYGAPTIRRRFFLIARCDGRPIVWPAQTHAEPESAAVRTGQLKPWRTAAECIDFSLPCPSIFERKRPLAAATCRRVAKGIMKFVVDCPNPFIIPVTHWGDVRAHSLGEPIRTVTGAHRGEMALVSPTAASFYGDKGGAASRVNPVTVPLRVQTASNRHAVLAATLVQTGYGERPGQAPRVPGLGKPLGTCVGGQKHAVVSAFLAKHYGGVTGVPVTGPTGTVTTQDHHSLVTASLVRQFGKSVGSSAEAPIGTITAGGGGKTSLMTAQLVGCGGRAGQSRPRDASEPFPTVTAKADSAVITSNLIKMRGAPESHAPGQPSTEPLHTISAQGNHFYEVRAFLTKYYGARGQEQSLRDPMHTIPAVDRFGLVTVAGEEMAIGDIGLRMLQPRELFRAQGFPDSYIIGDDGRANLALTKSDQVRMCGNSVCPPLAQALVAANVPEMAAWSNKERRTA